MHRVTLDIHNYDHMYAQAEAQVRQGAISDRNKQLIFSYRDTCLLQQTCGKVRLIRVMGVLVLYARILAKDFDQATREDLQALVTHLLTRQPAYSAETISTYKAILKRFYTWLGNPNEFSHRAPAPPLVAWITTHVRTKDKKKLQRGDLLIPDDIERAIAVSQNVRDKSLVANLWETGGRIAEVGNLQNHDVTKDEYGYTLDVNGKTGHRTILIVSSAPLLTQWLNMHPFRNDPEAPLWVHYQYADKPHPLRYSTIRSILSTLFRRAGITKRVYPHLFRHSRATYCLASGLMTEAQAKAYFGWTPNSDQLATYAHLLASDANAAILRENNLAPTKPLHDELRATKCYRCSELNASFAEYCTKCGAVLDLKKAYQHQQLHDMKDSVVMTMVKLMVEKGLKDEAARAIHDAGLGHVLRDIALHESGEHPIDVKAIVKPEPLPVKLDASLT
jgi:integrase